MFISEIRSLENGVRKFLRVHFTVHIENKRIITNILAIITHFINYFL